MKEIKEYIEQLNTAGVFRGTDITKITLVNNVIYVIVKNACHGVAMKKLQEIAINNGLTLYVSLYHCETNEIAIGIL